MHYLSLCEVVPYEQFDTAFTDHDSRQCWPRNTGLLSVLTSDITALDEAKISLRLFYLNGRGVPVVFVALPFVQHATRSVQLDVLR